MFYSFLDFQCPSQSLPHIRHSVHVNFDIALIYTHTHIYKSTIYTYIYDNFTFVNYSYKWKLKNNVVFVDINQFVQSV